MGLYIIQACLAICILKSSEEYRGIQAFGKQIITKNKRKKEIKEIIEPAFSFLVSSYFSLSDSLLTYFKHDVSKYINH